MKIRLAVIILCFPLIAGNTGNELKKPERSNLPAGYIDITVESNINRLLFTYNLDGRCLSTDYNTERDDRKDISGSQIIVSVKDFKCTSLFVYRDFLTLLKADQYPFLKIDIPLNNIYTGSSDDSVLLKHVIFTVAGVSREYDITCKVVNTDDGWQILNGSAKIKLTDLEIDPPVKSLGLIKVKNEIIVNFGFCINDTRQIIKKFKI